MRVTWRKKALSPGHPAISALDFARERSGDTARDRHRDLRFLELRFLVLRSSDFELCRLRVEVFLDELRPGEPDDTRGVELGALGTLLREPEVTLRFAGVRGFRGDEVLMPDDRLEEERGAATAGLDDGLRLRLVLTRGALLGAGDRDRPTVREEPGRDRVAAGAETLEGTVSVRVRLRCPDRPALLPEERTVVGFPRSTAGGLHCRPGVQLYTGGRGRGRCAQATLGRGWSLGSIACPAAGFTGGTNELGHLLLLPAEGVALDTPS